MTTTTIDELELGDKVVIQTGKNEVEIHDVIEINYTDYFIRLNIDIYSTKSTC